MLFGAKPSRGAAPDVVFLPADSYGLGFGYFEVTVEFRAAFGPLLVGACELRLLLYIADLRFEGLKLSPPSWHDHADRLACLEDHGEVGAGELPVHREGGNGPVRLHYSL